MPYCSRCGNQITEEMNFCNRCGASLKPGVAPPPAPPPTKPPERYEKYEKREKETEKREKGEKHEKEATGYSGPIIGGIILILLGFLFYLMTLGMLRVAHVWPIFLLIVGVVLIIFGV
ncbi:MAG: zinc ribbon domain-containing protein, partial [Candidatus Bathyarchaeia archaeon]